MLEGPAARPGQDLEGLPRDFFAQERGVAAAEADEIVRQTSDVLDHPDFATAFAPGSRAEVAIVADLPELREVHKVDERLVVLAKALGARVVTNDFNLNKIAQLQGVEVINLNELANSLKLVALPGEHLSVRIVKQGDQLGQGVGYLDDGTMVVVEQGRSHIGQEVSITVTSVLQTPAGRMILAAVCAAPPQE